MEMKVAMPGISDRKYTPETEIKFVPEENKTGKELSNICFIGTYPPIMCGIADYTKFITSRSPSSNWGVLSFDLQKYGGPLTSDKLETGKVWYGISGRESFSASSIFEGLNEIGAKKENTVLWFQHEHGIWSDDTRFVTMLEELDIPKVVTFHTIHFQSSETKTGLRKRQYCLLKELLPCVEAVTVFSHGARHAVASAFPEYNSKIHVMKHGIHSYPNISCMSRKQAKEKLNDYLLNETALDRETREALSEQKIFLDPDMLIIGQTGFLARSKGTRLLYTVRSKLQKMVPNRKIVAVRMGSIRDRSQEIYARRLRRHLNSKDEFLLVVPPNLEILPLSQRAFNINFYWPDECTQSGIVAHALGAGAVVAGRDMEGVGETLKEAGQIVEVKLGHLLEKIKEAILNPELEGMLQGTASNYAAEYSWQMQAQRHYELANYVLVHSLAWAASHPPVTTEGAAIQPA